MTYTIKEIADLAGVSTRTLRYYDEIGLMQPADMGENGYRYYDEKSLLRLQQILFFRELDVPLKEIELIMSQPDFNLLQALEKHHLALQSRAKRLTTLIDTVEQTIMNLKGEWKMEDKDLFEGFDQSQYEDEVKERWGNTSQYRESQQKWGRLTKAQQKEVMEQGGEISLRMIPTDASIPADDPGVQQAVADYFAYLNKNFYTCDVQFLRNLADMWVADERFAINFERIREGGAEFAREAVHIYCDNH